MSSKKNMINPDSALPKVVSYLEQNEGIFYRGKDIVELADFSSLDGITPHGLTMSLANIINWEDAEHYKTLEKVSQLRLLPMGDVKPLGVYYAVMPEGEREKRYGGWLATDGREGTTTINIYENGEVKDIEVLFVKVDDVEGD